MNQNDDDDDSPFMAGGTTPRHIYGQFMDNDNDGDSDEDRVGIC